MEDDEVYGEQAGDVKLHTDFDEGEGPPALNSTILNYYKKFGRKRDLEQYFSLSTAQSEIRDPTSLFWRRIKAMSDSSDSGEKRSATPTELCRISIKCSMPNDLESPSSQEKDGKTKSDTESPPIITEDYHHADDTERHSDNDSVKSDKSDNASQKSFDATLDTSMNKLLSPSSSITSQRKLEWDSLADVGYANENEQKHSATSLSTLERLALHQQYSNNDTHNANIGLPTAHSTPLDENDNKSKGKCVSKTTKIFRKDKDIVQVDMPHISHNAPAINVNLTKHISFNVDGDHKITKDTKDYTSKDVSVQLETIPDTVAAATSQIKMDKEIQTTLIKQKEKSSSSTDMTRSVVPVLINLNTLRRRQRRKKVHHKKSKPRTKRKEADKENISMQEKSGEQVSEAESFEYMPGHIYNQNQLKKEECKPRTTVGNKSSLESSGNFTNTDSSKGSKHSFTKDLEKSLNLLKATLNKRYDDSNLKQKLIKEVVQRLLKSNYRDDESTTDFLSGLSFGSAKLGLSEATTTSTSEANTAEKQPKKSILRHEKFNSSMIASSSQSAPNLPSVSDSNKPVTTSLTNPLISSNTESDSSREKISSATAFIKTSSEELYQKYLEALKKEQAYKKHLKDKEMFLRQKLVCSESAIRMPAHVDTKNQMKLKELMKDLTRNNYDDGSGDASKLEGGSSSNFGPNLRDFRKQRSHSVFTLSSNECKCSNRSIDSRKPAPKEPKAGPSSDVNASYCPRHTEREKTLDVTDSSIQVDIKQHEENTVKKPCVCNKVGTRNVTHYVSDSNTGDIKYVCLCPENTDAENVSDKIMVYKCSRLTNKPVPACKTANTKLTTFDYSSKPGPSDIKKAAMATVLKKSADDTNKTSKSSQTNLAKLFIEKSKYKASPSSSARGDNESDKPDAYIHEATRQLQTEISINPRISDPSLCDIKIIVDKDCAILINEQYRQVSKSSLEKANSESTNHELVTIPSLHLGSEISEETSVSSENKEKRRQLRKMTFTKNSIAEQQSVSDQIGDSFEPVGELQDNLTIPIQGTNMTLMVKIGQNAHKLKDDFNKSYQGSASSKPSTKNSPRFQQRQNTDYHNSYRVNTLFAKEEYTSKPDDETLSYASKNVERGCDVQNDLLDDFFATQSRQFDEDEMNDQQKNGGPSGSSTYPKVQPKLFFRSNTDTNRVQGFEAPKICKCGCLEPDCECDQGCEIEEEEEVVKIPKPGSSAYPTAQLKSFLHSNDTNRPQRISNDRTQDFGDSKICKCGCLEPDCKCDQGCQIDEVEILRRNKAETLDRGECFKHPEPSLSKPQQCKLPHTSPKKVVCPCLPPAPCGNLCDETADCFKDAPQTQVYDSLYRGSPIPTRKSPTPPTSPRKLITQTPLEAPIQNLTNRMVREPDFGQTPFNPVGCRRPSETVQKQKFEKPQCPCPEEAVCGRTCDETADCYPQKVIARSGVDTETSDTEYPTKQTLDFFMQTEPVDVRNIELQKQTSSDLSKKSSDIDKFPELGTPKDFIKELINDITKRYSKKDIQRNQRKKCFNEIMRILNYLLETEDPDQDLLKALGNATSGATDSEQDVKSNMATFQCLTDNRKIPPANDDACCSKAGASSISAGPALCSPRKDIPKKSCVDKAVQLCPKRSRKVCCTESSDFPASSECACTSSDVPVCKLLDKIRKECDRYHNKRCKSHSLKRCETSSSTSVNCDRCKRTHHCHCRPHKCKSKPTKLVVDKVKKKCMAYNLIIQTSDSMISEEPSFQQGVPLRNIIVKVPPKKRLENMPFKEAEARIGRNMPSPRLLGRTRSRSLPNESGISSADEARHANVYSIKDYLERNRPDFLEQSSRRQNCLKMISENRNQQPCAPPRLKMVVVHPPNGHDNCAGCTQPVTMYCEGVPMPTKCTCTDPYNMHMMQKHVTRIEAPKFISEREMKKHSEKIYKSLPEVVRMKEELKKQSIKKTNLLMATIFNKNLQKKTLRGAVNLSNYNNVVKI